MNFKKFINSDYLKSNPLCGIGTYKDALNLATGSCTRYVKKLVLTGVEYWQLWNGNYFSSVIDKKGAINTIVCSHFINSSTGGISYDRLSTVGLKIAAAVVPFVSSVSELKEYLAAQYANGTPVTVWYILATPTTETITVPSGLSGTEVGYLNQSGAPTPANPIYPTANTVEKWFDINHYIMGTDTDTLTTLPAVLYPNAVTATVGLKGQMEQSSQPSPTTPIQPSECGDKTGNLCNSITFEKGRIDNGVVGYVSQTTELTTTINEINFTTNAQYRGVCSDFIEIPDGATELSFSGVFSGANGIGKKFVFYDTQKTWLNADYTFSITVDEGTVQIPNNAKYVRLSMTAQSVATAKIKNLMLNTGSTALPYEPYGYKIPILSGGVTTPVYLGEVQSTRKVKKLEFDGTENWVHRSGDPPNEFFLEINTINVVSNLAISTHYINQDSGSFVDLQDGHILVRLASSGDKTYIGLRDSNYPATSQGRDQLKEWLAQQYINGTPVTIWYALATPETAVVNEPLRKIGDYADEVSGITIPTTAGANTLSIGTTLQPSEVSVNYHGWHSMQSVHKMNILLAEKPLCSLTTGSIPYTDTLNLATGDVSRYIQQYTLDGTENWTAETSPTYTYSIPITAIEDTAGHKSSHFSCKAQIAQLTSGTFGVINGKLMLKYNSAATVDAFKQWLVQQYTNGTPVKMYIINSTPTTEIITVPTGLTGTVNGTFSQSRTPTPTNPLYPTANEVPIWN